MGNVHKARLGTMKRRTVGCGRLLESARAGDRDKDGVSGKDEAGASNKEEHRLGNGQE